MKIFVTGGAGYIGSVTTENLIAQGHEVVVFDNLYQGHRAAVHPQAVFVPGDLAIKAQINAAILEHKPEAVMHFAAYSPVGESMQKPFKNLQEITNNGLNLMEAMCEHGVKKFILSSTANLFDQPERMPIAEDERIIPGSPYGESKFIVERALHWLEKTHGMKYACLRYLNAAGASEERGEDPHETQLEAAVPRPQGHHRQRMEMASDPSSRLHRFDRLKTLFHWEIQTRHHASRTHFTSGIPPNPLCFGGSGKRSFGRARH